MDLDPVTLLAALGAAAGLLGLLTGSLALRRARRRVPRAGRTPHRGGAGAAAGPATASDIDALRHVALVRYDAFGDLAGRLSWSLALLDDDGSGVVLSSIFGRSESRTYAKGVTGGTSEQPLSPEEEQAVAAAIRRLPAPAS